MVLKFEQTNDIGGDTFTSLMVQSAPTTATGDELGALVMTLDLVRRAGDYHQKQKVTTAVIPQSDSSSSGVIDVVEGEISVAGGFRRRRICRWWRGRRAVDD